MLTLKEYQQKTLDALHLYCQRAVQLGDADTAYYQLTRQVYGTGIPYHPVAELPGLPYVCLRIPTGGGKTFVACHAIPILRQELARGDCPLVLWLVPSNAIRDQTLAALRERRHPYRQALDAQLGRVTVLDIAQALYVQRAVLDSGATLIVSTLQAFRVEDTDGRKVYETNGALMSHFDGYPDSILDRLDRRPDGSVIYSLANAIRLRRPLIIVDEAHNARTDLSFATLARFDPSAIVEFTATPDTERCPSNVLYTVSAAELQAEDMIKMPILLDTLPDWRALLGNAIAQLDHLERQARQEQLSTGEYIRPIMLLQAQPNYKDRDTITVDVLEKTLVEEFKIPGDQIARATGAERGLDGVDIFSPACPIRYVITIQALREGWDCAFAYVLCSVAEMSSSTAVEQMLGRIMRLPQARRKGQDDLNQAYAFAASASFAATANALVDGLVQNGFNPLEARDLIRPQAPLEQADLGPLFAAPAAPTETVPLHIAEKPDWEYLAPALAAKLGVDAEHDTLVFKGWMSEAERDALKAHLSSEPDKQAIDQAYQESQQFDPRTPAEKGIPFSLPRLAYRQGSLLEELDQTHFLEHPLRLTQRDTSLSEAEFPSALQRGQQARISISGATNQIEVEFLHTLHQQMALLATDKGWTVAELVYWLDRAIPHPDITAQESAAFINKLIHDLTDKRNLPLDQLVHDKYRLAAAVRIKIDAHRQTARNEALQMMLLPDSPLEVTPALCFTFDPRRYPYNRPYQGSYRWAKHYYPQVGDLKSDGEEFECARYIDTLDQVACWVRNPDGHSKGFSLQTATDRFYPDFVCRLKDGRTLAVEYKGEVYRSNDDSKEKNVLGEVWEKRSGGACLFLMVSDRQYEAIRAKIGEKLGQEGSVV
ncbi:MAG: DEAD/DEAH box helicase family protein [Anaerolineae bacterium]|nr:DEAD/DEAH box helicase family protein [Anaerolineae bacterium]